MASEGNQPFLPLDIIINILKRVSVKSIVQFRSVCKDWKNLFKTPNFIAEQARHSAHQNPLLLLHESDYDYKATPPFLRLVNQKMETVEVLTIPSINCFKHGWKIIGSCNGLLCIQVHPDQGRSPCSLCLWNPVIREVREIPETTRNARNDYLDMHKFGLGFSSVINDFKIVKFYKQELHKKKNKKKAALLRHHGVEVYSLSTGSWKELEFVALQNTTIISKASSVDGTIFWLGLQDSCHVLVSFDVATEVLTITQIPLTSRHQVYKTTTTLSVYQNKFAIYQYYCDCSFNSIDIWAMEEVATESGKSFSCVKICNVSTIAYFFGPLCIWRNEIVCRDEVENVSERKYYLELFNVTTKKWKKFPDSDSSVYHFCAGFNYEESLMSVWNS
ncbi:hypothetical protein QN277_005704 [Acacia crassicarpa]|uniref:F-box domain-containing protein n=1 Tax=Acacia crassicarpa TaxID=499986 RepID=A0AAE1IZQ6_9FABA|nr:hypothetical protein QN277_005704 [Acacia crassicarpa]